MSFDSERKAKAISLAIRRLQSAHWHACNGDESLIDGIVNEAIKILWEYRTEKEKKQ
jgi:hypothetical protein